MINGFVFRELYLGKKNYLAIGISTFLALVLEIMIMLSMNFGNLSRLDEESYKTVDLITFYLFIFGIALVFYSAFVGENTVVSDKKCGWKTFAYTLPVSEKKWVWTKFSIKIAGLVCGLVLSILNALMVCGIRGKEMNSVIFKGLLVAFALMAVVSFVNTTLMIRFKSASVVSGIMFAAFAVIYLSAMNYIRTLLFDRFYIESEEDLDAKALLAWARDIWDRISPFIAPVLIILVIAVFAICFNLCVRIMKRRES